MASSAGQFSRSWGMSTMSDTWRNDNNLEGMTMFGRNENNAIEMAKYFFEKILFSAQMFLQLALLPPLIALKLVD